MLLFLLQLILISAENLCGAPAGSAAAEPDELPALIHQTEYG
nr:hypothetical protein [Marinobacterium profundum]